MKSRVLDANCQAAARVTARHSFGIKECTACGNVFSVHQKKLQPNVLGPGLPALTIKNLGRTILRLTVDLTIYGENFGHPRRQSC